MGMGGIIIVLICFMGPLAPPIIGTIVGTAYDTLTARRLRERHAVKVEVGVRRSGADAAPSRA